MVQPIGKRKAWYKNMEEKDEIFEDNIYTLTDEDGTESDFELIGSVEVDGVNYYALVPYTESEEMPEEYIVLRGEMEDGEEVLVSIDDDEEFDRIADIFDDEFADIDYDMEPEDIQ